SLIEDNAEAGRQDACAPRLPASPIEDNAEAGRQDACAPRLRLGDVSCRLCSDADLKRATRMATTISDTEHVSTDNLDLMLAVLPKPIRDALERAGHMESLIEVVLDLGRRSEARYTQQALYLDDSVVTREDLHYVASRVGQFTRDNRAGIERTLHRISAMRNRVGEIVGLTCRVGRAIYGTVDIIRDIVESGKSIL